MGDDQLEPATEDARARLRQKPGPAGKRRLRRVDGRGRLCGREARHLADDLSGRRIGHSDGRARSGGAPLAADIGKAADKTGIGRSGQGRGDQHEAPRARLVDGQSSGMPTRDYPIIGARAEESSSFGGAGSLFLRHAHQQIRQGCGLLNRLCHDVGEVAG